MGRLGLVKQADVAQSHQETGMAYDPEKYWIDRTRETLAQGHGVVYDRDYELWTLASDRVAWVREQLKVDTPPDVLEIGCGFGRWSAALKGRYASYMGVDIVPERIEWATLDWGSETASFQLVSADGDWSIEGVFDVVMLVTVIQHLPLAPACEVLRTARSHLAHGGKILLVEWQIHDLPPEEVAEIGHPEHMIPKPMSVLQEAIPDLVWSGKAGEYILQ